jgi:hypothetical protein
LLPCRAAGADPEALKWHQQAELVHGRWAMLGAAGVLVPELLTKARAWAASCVFVRQFALLHISRRRARWGAPSAHAALPLDGVTLRAAPWRGAAARGVHHRLFVAPRR